MRMSHVYTICKRYMICMCYTQARHARVMSIYDVTEESACCMHTVRVNTVNDLCCCCCDASIRQKVASIKCTVEQVCDGSNLAVAWNAQKLRVWLNVTLLHAC